MSDSSSTYHGPMVPPLYNCQCIWELYCSSEMGIEVRILFYSQREDYKYYMEETMV